MALGLAVQGCGVANRPDTARILLEGPASASMTLVTSQKFFVRADGGIEFQSSDTLSIAVPFDETVRLGAPARFYISAANAEAEPWTFRLQIWIGDRSWYDETKILDPGEDFEFVYRYDEPGIY
jgi:hypothetical protein